ncbi:ribulokinase [candidate division KSB1 bacterium]|nr:ribulokinase [candidate division KSB1 bacterium]
MAIVAGIDFGTLSVRTSIFDSEKGRLGSATAGYELIRKSEDPDHATQRQEDQMLALIESMKNALKNAGVDGGHIAALAIDTTGSSVIPVDENLKPLGDYYLWCDHRSKNEAAEITKKAHEENLENIKWCGGTYSSEWGFSKVLHWLRNNPEKRDQFSSSFEHCDLIVGLLCGAKSVGEIKRSICAAGHKWMWVDELDGLPSESFLTKVDPLLAGVRDKMSGEYAASFKIAGKLSPDWAAKLGIKQSMPIPVGAFDAHWDAIGAGIKEGDVVNVIGTSTCIMAITKQTELIPGVAGVVKGSIHPDYYGIEAGLSAVGDIFDSIALRAGTSVGELSKGLEKYKGGQTGLLRFSWDNGDRTVLTNPELGGMTLGWNLTHQAQDELFAAIEGTAFHTRIILERMKEYGVPINRVINGGGIPQKNDVLNQVYANVLNVPILVPEQEVTSLGSAIFAFMAAGAFKSIEEAQEKLCSTYRIFSPEKQSVEIYEELFAYYRKLYFAFGQHDSTTVWIGEILPQLRKIAERVRLKK